MDLKDYIHGKRHGKEANQLEQKAMDNSFLQDAIDGFDSVPGNHSQTLNELEQRFVQRKKPKNFRLWIWSAAALLLLLIGTQLFVWIRPEKTDIPLATSVQPSTEKSETPLSDTISDAILSTDEKIVADVMQPAKPNVKTKEEQQKIKADINEIASVLKSSEKDTAEPILAADIEVTLDTLGAEMATNTPITIRGIQSNTRIQNSGKNYFGRVVDETGEPIIGATIALKDTKTGVVTDTDGKFSLVLPNNKKDTLIASFIGFKKKEIPLNEALGGDITMKSDDLALNEVVVTGMGSQKKRSVTGAISTIDVKTLDDIKKVPTFGKTDFIEYFKQHYDKNICPGQSITIVAEFYIDANGRPGNIQIKKIPCPEMETELKRLLLGSPLWSERNRMVELKIEL